MAVRKRRGVGAVDRRTKGRLVVVIVCAHHVEIVGDRVFHAGPGHMEQFVAGAERGVVDVGVVDGRAAGEDEVSADVDEAAYGDEGIDGRRFEGGFVTADTMLWTW